MLSMTAKKQEKRTKGNIPPQKFEEWIHAQVTDPELWRKFEIMAKAHQGGKSAFIRWLIDQEWTRQGKDAHWVGKGMGDINE